MNRNAIGWVVFALAALGLSAYLLILGGHLLPTGAEMQGRLKTVAPLVITWGMIGIGALIGLALAGILIATALSETRDAL